MRERALGNRCLENGMFRHALPAVLVGLLLASTPARAAQEILPAIEHAAIVDEDLNSRILVQFDSVDHLSSEWIMSAALHFPLAGEFSTPMALLADVPVTSWDASATWDAPWSIGGGDPDGDQTVLKQVAAGPGSGVLSIDVTYLIRSMQSGDLPENGFLLWPAHPSREGFTPAEMAVLGGGAVATLEVSYRKLSAHGITP